MMASYFDQFTIVSLGSIFFTNSTLMLVAAFLVTTLLFLNKKIIPSNSQIIFELIYSH